MNYIINFHKPGGITSQQAVSRIKRILKVKKAGHTGTLDPLATGVMLVCLGEATKVSRFFLDMDKKYRARVKLGERTDTYDAEGRITATGDTSSLDEETIFRAVLAFKGSLEQTPPMYSAVKKDGMPLYKLARKGIEVERRSRHITIYDISVAEIALPYFDLTVACSKGTYIRSLCDDIGQKLGTGAHLYSLERLAVGRFNIAEALTFEDLERGETPVPDGCSVFSIDAALCGMPEINLDDQEGGKVRQGRRIPVGLRAGHQEQELLKIKGPGGELIGIGRVREGMIVVERNLNL